MIGLKRAIYCFLILLLFNHLAYAIPYFGINFSYPLVAKEPPDLNGAQFMLSYDPGTLQWKTLNIYFDGGYSHFKTGYEHHSTINIYSVAPVFRFYFERNCVIHPFIEFSIGLSYLNHTRIEKRNLGIHFAFQDRIGVGSFFGRYEHLTIGLHAVHYSNAHFSNHNSGITIPLALDVGYRF